MNCLKQNQVADLGSDLTDVRAAKPKPDAPGTRTMPPEDGIWETIAEGINRKVVYVDRDRDVQGFFIRMKAGAILPTHTHALDEHCVVLSGWLRVGQKEFGMGTYHLAERDTDHLALSTPTGTGPIRTFHFTS